MGTNVLREPYILCPHVRLTEKGLPGYMEGLYRLGEGTLCLCRECKGLLEDQVVVEFLLWRVTEKREDSFIGNLKTLFKRK